MILKGFRVDDLRTLVAGAMEPVLKPLVYQEPLDLVERHRERGEPVYIVSATLQEIVDELAARARLRRRDRVDLRDRGRRVHRPLAPRAATARGRPRRCASSPSGRASIWPPRPRIRTATPTCPSSRRSATPSRSTPTGSCGESRLERGWPVLEFRSPPFRPCRRLRPALVGIPLVLGAGAAVWAARRRAA